MKSIKQKPNQLYFGLFFNKNDKTWSN